MELVDRYLYAVRSGLPKGQQDDIIAELAEDIRSEIEDLETGLGRPVNEAEVVEILKQRGHPTKVASRYMPQQYLIGPALYPIYQLVLKIVVLGVLLPVFLFVVAPIAIATVVHPTQALIKTLWDLAMSAVFTVGVVTVVFAIMEHYPVKFKAFEEWDPRRLPRIPKSTAGSRGTPRATAIFELAASLIAATLFVAWFRTTFDLGGIRITLTPIWRSIYWPSLLVILSGVPKGWVSLMWPERTRLRFGFRVAINAATLILAAILLNAGTWVELTGLGFPAPDIAEAAKWTNFGIKISLIMAAVIAIGDAIPEGMRLFKKKTPWNYSIAT
jgi:hypothetical protein